MAWNAREVTNRIAKAWKDTDGLVVKDFGPNSSFENLGLKEAYSIDAVHVYLDVPNALALNGNDSENDHKKLLRYLNVFMRVAHLVLARTGALKVALQDTRLHFVVWAPFDSERLRIERAITIAALLRDAFTTGNALHAELPDARVVAGIESGKALVVRNGAQRDREPLFIGNPANLAAKLADAAAASGIYLGPSARNVLGGTSAKSDPKRALSASEIDAARRQSGITLTSTEVARAWDQERKQHPIAEVKFSRHTPPLSTLPLDELTLPNSRRQQMIVMYGDVDGFTAFVARQIATSSPALAVRLLHVIRKELRDVVAGFDGRKIRYIGDCVLGVISRGTRETDQTADSVEVATLCAAAMRSSFAIIRQLAPEAAPLGLQVGFELGQTALSRVGVQNSRDRCAVGSSILTAEREQARCRGNETAIGTAAYEAAPSAVKACFGASRIAADLHYDKLALALTRQGRTEHARTPGVPGSTAPRAFGD